MTTASRSAVRWIACGFCAGVLLALSARALPAFMDAYLDASRARFDLMTEVPPGEASYLISYDDFATLETLARADADILALNAGNIGGIGRITFSHAQSPAIERVRQHPNTAFMLSTTIPLICH
ncbi:MAG: hypothetical protein AAGA11_14495 [Pseudomonadota bacterium]